MAFTAVSFQIANAGGSTPGSMPRTLSAPAAGQLASDIASDLGTDSAGSYYDAESRTLTVNVLDETAAKAVRKAGGKARIVANSLAELKSARETLADKATIPGTAWAVDPITNKVIVTADPTVTGSRLTQLTQVVQDLGGGIAELRTTSHEFTQFAAGGDSIVSDLGRCSLGFNVAKNGAPAFLTAGHCSKAGRDWTDARGNVLGRMTQAQAEGNDFAIVRYTDPNATAPSEVDLYNGTTQKITHAAEATVGMEVTRSGATTGVHGGRVTGLDATVNFQNGGIVQGLIQTNVCAEPGDSGGSLFSGDAAVGLTSGGSGNCSIGGVTYFQPVPEALRVLGAEIGNSGTPGEPGSPGDPTSSPGDPTNSPGEPGSPGDPTGSPGDPTSSPGDPTNSPGDPTGSPGEPPCPSHRPWPPHHPWPPHRP